MRFSGVRVAGCRSCVAIDTCLQRHRGYTGGGGEGGGVDTRGNTRGGWGKAGRELCQWRSARKLEEGKCNTAIYRHSEIQAKHTQYLRINYEPDVYPLMCVLWV